MKKLLTVFMALCVMLTAVTAVTAFAGEAAPTVVNWSDHEAEAAKIEGQFANVAQTGLKMFVPAEFKDTEIPKEALDGGTFMILKTEKEEKAVVNAQLIAADAAALKAKLQSEGKTVWDTVINGLPCLQFSVDVNGVTTSCFAFGTEKGSTVMFSFILVNQEPYTGLYKLMAASIQRAE